MTDIQKLYDFYLNHFAEFISTFEECSINSCNPGNPLVKSRTKCFNFDEIKKKIFYPETPCCSVDSLFFDINKGVLYFIEFKDQKIRQAKKNFIRSCKESYIVNRFISSFPDGIDIGNIIFSSLLVVDSLNNSTYFSTEKARERSRSNNSPNCLTSIEQQLKGLTYLGETLFFDDVQIMSESEFDKKFQLK